MSPCCDLDLENSKPIFLHDTQAHDDASQYQLWFKNVWRFRRYHLDKHWHFGPSLWPWPWNSHPIFSQNTLAFDDVSSDQVWLPRNQQFRRYSRKSHVLIKWVPWAWHSGSWCCITIPSLVTKCSAVQKISSRQTFTDILNLHCDLDLECSNPIFQQDTPAYDAVLTNQDWLQMDQQFRRESENNQILIV